METKILQITSGRGPAECCWVVAQVLKLIIEEATKANITYTVLHREMGIENGTLFSAGIQLEGNNLNTFTKNWTGTILWVGQSQFRKHHKRKNWYVAVNELGISDDCFDVDDNDIHFQAIRSGGPGGQHVNKVSTAIRAKHIPSGLSVHVSESRSQLQNKKQARQRLIELIKLEQFNHLKSRAKAEWENHTDIERGNPVKTFYGSDFKSQHIEKNYKTKRHSLKNSLRKELLD